MKKAFWIIAALAVVLLVAGSAMAAWTVTASREAASGPKSIIKIELTGDGTALSQNVWSLIDVGNIGVGVAGKYIYRYKTDPDGTNAPASTYALTITDKFGDTATLSARSTTVTQYGTMPGVTASGGYLSIYGYLLLTCEDIGSGNTTVLYLEVVE